MRLPPAHIDIYIYIFLEHTFSCYDLEHSSRNLVSVQITLAFPGHTSKNTYPKGSQNLIQYLKGEIHSEALKLVLPNF